jgi:hypothetical protein
MNQEKAQYIDGLIMDKVDNVIDAYVQDRSTPKSMSFLNMMHNYVIGHLDAAQISENISEEITREASKLNPAKIKKYFLGSVMPLQIGGMTMIYGLLLTTPDNHKPMLYTLTIGLTSLLVAKIMRNKLITYTNQVNEEVKSIKQITDSQWTNRLKALKGSIEEKLIENNYLTRD